MTNSLAPNVTPVIKSFQYGKHTVKLETGAIARQASGAVMVSVEDTVVLVTAVGRKEAKPGQDFFPLTVNYQERFYAGGKIPGGFFKREGRPTEKETLTSRLIDRPIRPLFPKAFKNEVQVIATVVSINPEIDPDIPAMIGASAALALSGMPFRIFIQSDRAPASLPARRRRIPRSSKASGLPGFSSNAVLASARASSARSKNRRALARRA